MTIGQYRVTGLLGRGGMGAVYAAEHTLLGRPAAIKLLLPELSQKQDIVTRLFNEARAATAIRHPGIVEIYDVGWTSDGAAYIVMERLEGETLAARAARGRLHWTTTLTLARQIAGALAAAHGKGIVHRDLKPDNVFLVRDPEVPGGERIKLLDFGIAKLADSSSSHMTSTGMLLGTPTYMAPEQCRGVRLDHRADLYALGCVMYELCCGRPPFVGEGTGDVLAAHIHLPPPSLALDGRELPSAVEQLVLRLLAKAPEDRPRDGDQVVQAIDTALGAPAPGRAGSSHDAVPVTTAPSSTTLSGATAAATAPLNTPRRGRPVSALLLGLAGLGVVATLAMTMRRGNESPAGEPPPPAPTASLAATTGLPARVASTPEIAPPAPSVAEGPPAEHAAAAPPTEHAAAPPAAAPDRAIDVELASTPPGAQVVRDGLVVGTTPYRGSLPSHTAQLVLRLAGYVDKTIAIHAAPIHDSVTLVRRPTPPGHNSAANSGDRSVNPF